MTAVGAHHRINHPGRLSAAEAMGDGQETPRPRGSACTEPVRRPSRDAMPSVNFAVEEVGTTAGAPTTLCHA